MTKRKQLGIRMFVILSNALDPQTTDRLPHLVRQTIFDNREKGTLYDIYRIFRDYEYDIPTF